MLTTGQETTEAFTPEEDNQLVIEVQRLIATQGFSADGLSLYQRIAPLFPGRDFQQLRKHYLKTLRMGRESLGQAVDMPSSSSQETLLLPVNNEAMTQPQSVEDVAITPACLESTIMHPMAAPMTSDPVAGSKTSQLLSPQSEVLTLSQDATTANDDKKITTDLENSDAKQVKVNDEDNDHDHDHDHDNYGTDNSGESDSSNDSIENENNQQEDEEIDVESIQMPLVKVNRRGNVVIIESPSKRLKKTKTSDSEREEAREEEEKEQEKEDEMREAQALPSVCVDLPGKVSKPQPTMQESALVERLSKGRLDDTTRSLCSEAVSLLQTLTRKHENVVIHGLIVNSGDMYKTFDYLTGRIPEEWAHKDDLALLNRNPDRLGDLLTKKQKTIEEIDQRFEYLNALCDAPPS